MLTSFSFLENLTMAEATKKLKKIEDVMKEHDVSRDFVNRQMKNGNLEYFKVGWQIRFSDDQIETFLEKCRNAPRLSRKKPSNLQAV